ncbi:MULTISPECIES: hypothetical protein [unclassified Chryseobacterium]|uniref:glycoside hydrolase family 19 protein n=1 Tax=unclassified Chryseobacterium TaxID=2593645 RepID=UPI0022698E35|nr:MULTISPECIES: hypothetical protein [unclassified Chryseobacterium]
MGKILSGIKGERFPLIGKQAQKYSVTFDESADIGTINDDEILWQIYAANEYDKYEKVPFSGQKKGKLTTYTFFQKLLNKNLQLQATYKNETVELHITPQENGEIKIIDVFFLDIEYKIREKDNLKYMNSVNLQIYTLNMLDKYVDFKIFGTLNGTEKELYKSDQPLKIEQKNGIVKTKKSILLSPAMYIQTQQDLSASVHSYRIKVWETDNENNFYEEGLTVKNEMGKMEVPQDSQTPVKTGTSEPVKKKEEEKKKNACSDDFTLSQIKEVWPSAKNIIWVQGIVDELNKSYEIKGENKKLYEIFELNTCLKRAHFFAQAFVESSADLSGAFNGEGLNYSVEALRSGYPFSVFKNNKKYYDYADNIGRKSEIDPITKKKKIVHPANQEEIANIAYNDNNRGAGYKLGNIKEGDGWKFRGRGLMQITGRSNYKNIQEIIDKRLPNSSIDLSLGKSTFTAKEAVFAGLGDWILKNANILAENGATPEIVNSITAKINYSTKSYKDRRDAFIRTIKIFKDEK